MRCRELGPSPRSAAQSVANRGQQTHAISTRLVGGIVDDRLAQDNLAHCLSALHAICQMHDDLPVALRRHCLLHQRGDVFITDVRDSSWLFPQARLRVLSQPPQCQAKQPHRNAFEGLHYTVE